LFYDFEKFEHHEDISKDDLVGYWQATLNRMEPYPRDRQDVYDSTGNIQLDYTLFGFDKMVEPDSEFINQ
jgi:hypothetical protein